MPPLAGSSRRLLAGAGSLVFVLPIVGTWTTHGVPPVIKALSTALLLLTAMRPLWGVWAIVALLPFNPLLQAYLSPEYNAATLAEMMLAPVLLAACLRFALGLRAPASRLAPAALVLGAVIAASGFMVLAARQQATTWPGEFIRSFVQHLSDEYYDQSAAFEGFHSALNWIEGLTLMVVAERLIKSAGVPPIALLAPLAVAVLHTWQRLIEISLRREHPIVAAIGFLREERINTFYRDINAAGSLFALYLIPLLWMAYTYAMSKVSGARRLRAAAGCAAAAIVVGGALWMTHSRTAWAGALVAGVLVWIYSRRPSWLVFGATVAATAVLLTFGIVMNPGTETQSSMSISARVRWEMAKIALDLTREQPVFGVGIGEFRTVSRRLVSDDLLKLFPATGSGENAHNNFLQILTELGVTGLAAFLWVLGAAAATVVGASDPDAPRHGQIALAGGVLAFLISCLGGHPFLTIEVLWLFLLFVGGTAALRADSDPPSARLRTIAVTLMLLVVASAPVRLWQLTHDEDRRTIVGAGPPTDSDADRVYRRAGARSSWPVSSHARAVEFSLKLSKGSQPPCLVRIAIDGRPANTIDVRGDVWSPVLLQLDPRPRGTPPRIVDLQVDSPTCRLMVGTFTLKE